MNVDPITDDETLYRRVPVSTNWYSQESGLTPEAFGPNKEDHTGISLSREKYKTIQDAARGRSAKGYYVAVLNAGAVRANGIAVEPRPVGDDPGHAEIPDITIGNKKDTATLEKQRVLASICQGVQGPFSSPSAG